MTIEEFLDRFFDNSIFTMSLYSDAEHIGDFKSNSIGLEIYKKYKITLWCFGKSDRSLVLYVKEENE